VALRRLLFPVSVAATALLFWTPADAIAASASSLPAGADKVVHATTFMALGLIGHATQSRRWWFVLMVWAAVSEGGQTFVPGRTPSLGDLVADSIGIALAMTWATLHARRTQGV